MPTEKPTKLWCRRPELAEELAVDRTNAAYLPGARLPEELEVTADMGAMGECDPILVVVPSHGYREAVRGLMPFLAPENRPAIVSCTKGVETETWLVERGDDGRGREGWARRRIRRLVRPHFRRRVGGRMPTAAVIASEGEALALELQQELSTASLRLYSTDDVAGVEIGGTSKNVIAIAAGVASGVGLGHNTLAALITRGLHEISRLGVACGGRARTLAGLAGLGDLVLTCTGDLSRNRQDRAQAGERTQAGSFVGFRDGRRGNPEFAGCPEACPQAGCRDADNRPDGGSDLRREGSPRGRARAHVPESLKREAEL